MNVVYHSLASANQNVYCATRMSQRAAATVSHPYHCTNRNCSV